MKNIYLLVLISIVSITSLIWGLFEHYIINIQLYIGLILLLMSFIFYFKFKTYFNYLLGIVLLISSFGIIYFVPFQMAISIGFITIQIIPFLFLIAFCFINKSRILDLFQNINSKSIVEKNNDSQSKYERFKKDFENLSDTEIENRLNYYLTPEAKEALLEIKKERAQSI